MNRRPGTSLAQSPILVGTFTVLVTMVAVFVSYNANAGLPFVPTYDVTARLPDAAGLVRGNEVRVGGKRIGTISSIEADETGEEGDESALLELKLEQKAGPVREDTEIRVRPRSALGLKYLELTPGRRGRPIPHMGALPRRAAQEIVDLDEVVNAFDAETRRALQRGVAEFGTGLAGRGADFNRALAEAPAFLSGVERVARNLRRPETDLRGFLHGLDSALGELEPVAAELGSMIASADTTAAALDSRRPELGAVIEGLAPTERAGVRALRAARPLLRDASVLLRDLRPGTRFLPTATTRLHAALRTGTPVLRRAVALAGRLEGTLGAVERLSADPATRRTLERLLATLVSAEPTLEFVAPMQIRCNYFGLWTRNVNSTISEGDAGGTWFRTLVVIRPQEAMARSEPDQDLHANPYPHTGQNGECEAGNEPYLPGRQIGNPAGAQRGATEDTTPPPEVPRP